MAEATAIETRLQQTDDGAILFDAHAVAQATSFADAWFEPDHWLSRGAAQGAAGGRGGITLVRNSFGNWALRHYRRGGMIARVLGDRYLWAGADRTRSFSEFRLLAELAGRGLNVSRPVAARYQRSGTHYHADLITHYIADAHTFAHSLRTDGIDSAIAKRVGEGIARLHAVGAYHADLNANNVLIDAREVWLIDFDRGELRIPQRGWQQDNLARLRRSLIKLGAAHDGESVFENRLWQPLLEAYEDGLARAKSAATNAIGASVR